MTERVVRMHLVPVTVECATPDPVLHDECDGYGPTPWPTKGPAEIDCTCWCHVTIKLPDLAAAQDDQEVQTVLGVELPPQRPSQVAPADIDATGGLGTAYQR
jgi:hypothetical protein